MKARLTVRFSPVYQSWIGSIAGDQADAVRALMVIGAAALGLPGADREALRLLESDLRADVEDVLLDVADKRQTSGRQIEVSLAGQPELLEAGDPFTNIGIEV